MTVAANDKEKRKVNMLMIILGCQETFCKAMMRILIFSEIVQDQPVKVKEQAREFSISFSKTKILFTNMSVSIYRVCVCVSYLELYGLLLFLLLITPDLISVRWDPENNIISLSNLNTASTDFKQATHIDR